MNRPSPMSVFVQAMRPKTLGAAAAPVAVGAAVAHAGHGVRVLPLLAAFVGAMLLQIGCNFANDYFDFENGADTEDRLGPARATQQGWVTPSQMKRWFTSTFALLAPVAVYLVAVGGWPIAVIGVASIAAAILYTGGPKPLGYLGLGDVMVFVFFGPVAVLGTAWVQGTAPTVTGALASVVPGLLSTAILVVNNQRDRVTDVHAGKRTLAVRFGSTFSKVEYVSCLALAFSIPLLVWALGASPWVLLPMAALPLALHLTRQFLSLDGAALNPLLGGTARLLMVHSLLFSIGWVVG